MTSREANADLLAQIRLATGKRDEWDPPCDLQTLARRPAAGLRGHCRQHEGGAQRQPGL